MDNSTEINPFFGDPYLLVPSPSAIALPTLSFIALVLTLPCWIWHMKNRNIPASCLVFWIGMGNLYNFIDALIWPTDDLSTWWQGHIYCDIEVKLELASNVGVVGALACILHSLAAALDTQNTVLSLSRAERRRKTIIESLVCFGLPLYIAIAHYIVQPTRYYIFAIAGCTPSFDSGWPAIPLVYIWPLAFCLVDIYYAVLIIHRLRVYRRDFAAVLGSSSSGLNQSRFLRLFVAALTTLTIFFPAQVYLFYVNVSYPVTSYSWSAIHGPGWQEITLVPTFGVVTFNHWILIPLGLTVFFCFGFGQEAKSMYTGWLVTLGLDRVFSGLQSQNSDIIRNVVSSATSSSRSRSFSKARQFFVSHKSKSAKTTFTTASTLVSSSSPTRVSPESEPSSPITSSTNTASDKLTNRVVQPSHQSKLSRFLRLLGHDCSLHAGYAIDKERRQFNGSMPEQVSGKSSAFPLTTAAEFMAGAQQALEFEKHIINNLA